MREPIHSWQRQGLDFRIISSYLKDTNVFNCSKDSTVNHNILKLDVYNLFSPELIHLILGLPALFMTANFRQLGHHQLLQAMLVVAWHFSAVHPYAHYLPNQDTAKCCYKAMLKMFHCQAGFLLNLFFTFFLIKPGPTAGLDADFFPKGHMCPSVEKFRSA